MSSDGELDRSEESTGSPPNDGASRRDILRGGVAAAGGLAAAARAAASACRTTTSPGPRSTTKKCTSLVRAPAAKVYPVLGSNRDAVRMDPVKTASLSEENTS